MELARGIEPPTGGLPINWQGIVQVFEKADNPSSFVHKHWLLFSVFLLHVLSLRGQKFLNIPPKCLHQQVEVIRHQNISMEGYVVNLDRMSHRHENPLSALVIRTIACRALGTSHIRVKLYPKSRSPNEFGSDHIWAYRITFSIQSG